VPGQVVRIARRLLGLPLVNIGGTDLVGGAHKLLLAILWQLMRFHTRALLQSVAPPGARARRPRVQRASHAARAWCLRRAWCGAPARARGGCAAAYCRGLGRVSQNPVLATLAPLAISAPHGHNRTAELLQSHGRVRAMRASRRPCMRPDIYGRRLRSGLHGDQARAAAAGRHITDAQLDREVLRWANGRAAAAGRARRVAGFGDPALASGLFLLDLLAAVAPGRAPLHSCPTQPYPYPSPALP